jgi:phospholipase A2
MKYEHDDTLKGKTKGFWKNVVKPAFPEAITDISIIKNAVKVEHVVSADIHNPELFPEIRNVAEVRQGLDLAPQEVAFLQQRKVHVREHFAEYLGLDPEEVHPDDVPTVAFGGSGGGFRAMIAYMGYCEEMRRAGLWDILTYLSGVSGSCWAMAMFYTFGDCSWANIIEHSKETLSPNHPLSGDAIRATLDAPGGAYAALGPLVSKHKSGLTTVAMDLYSVFTTGHLFSNEPSTPRKGTGTFHKPHMASKIAGKSHGWYKWTSAAKHLENGAQPLPILTAIRHERPWKDWVDKESPFSEPDHMADQHKEALDAWFQWFEMSPFEIGCDELKAWVPTWGFGRPFELGKSTMQLPEQSLALLLGLCTSAPAGPLTSYLATINRALPSNFLGNTIHELAEKVSKLWGKERTEKFEGHHPLHACNEHNFIYHLTPVPEGEARLPGLENSPRIHLIDSGMDNNCPTYVMLHPERKVDVMLNMDASSDVLKDSFQQRVDQIGSRRGVKFTRRNKIKAGEDVKDPDRFKRLYAQIYDGKLQERPETVVDSYGVTSTNPPAPIVKQESKMVYMPLLPNERAVHDYDPSTAKFSGSYNLVWTGEQVQMLVDVCKQNFADGQEEIKTVLREAWMAKKTAREAGNSEKLT